MSAAKTPHYSHVVHDINRRGGLKIYFARQGKQGDAWVKYLDKIVPSGGVLFHETHAVDAQRPMALPGSKFHEALHNKAGERNTRLLPGGFYGESFESALPTFGEHELLALAPATPAHMTDRMVERYRELQAIREMRAAVGSLAWLAAYMSAYVAEYEAQPVALWGRTHGSSLPDMYERLGIHPVQVTHLDAPLRYSYIHPHGSKWNERQLQGVFGATYEHARSVFDSANTAT